MKFSQANWDKHFETLNQQMQLKNRQAGLMPYKPNCKTVLHKSISPDYFFNMGFSFNKFKKSVHITSVRIEGNSYWYTSDENVNVYIHFKFKDGQTGLFSLELHYLQSGEVFTFAELNLCNGSKPTISEKVYERETSKLAKRILNFFTPYINLSI